VDRVILFLSSCRFNVLDKAVKFIFSLPHDELFANRIIWFEDNQILAEISNIKKMTPMALQELTPVSDSLRDATPRPVDAPERAAPQPISLLPEKESR
jgi:hypothetical protein